VRDSGVVITPQARALSSDSWGPWMMAMVLKVLASVGRKKRGGKLFIRRRSATSKGCDC